LLAQGKQTRIDYEAEVQISGPLAGINPRFAEGVAQTLIRQGLAKLAELVHPRTCRAVRNYLNRNRCLHLASGHISLAIYAGSSKTLIRLE
jgi:hypothetical protein